MPRSARPPTVGRLTRRTFLKGSLAAGAAVAGGGLFTTAIHAKPRTGADTPLEHIVVACQENRSFDHYFGYAPQVQAAGFGPPAGFSQPDGSGGSVAPYRFTALSTPDIPHDWGSVHGQWDHGAMDGFMTHSGVWAMGYYTATELPFYYSLFADSTLCANFFCSLLGPTWPNRFYLMAGTSGGITTNGQWGYGIFDHPMILDLLDAAGITWKIYNLGWDSVPYGNTDNVAVFWTKYAHDNRTRGSKGSYLNDLRSDRLPQVSFLIPSYARGWDEHPPASVAVGMGIQEECVNALRQSSAWESSAYIITYDEHGGDFLGDLALGEARTPRGHDVRAQLDPQAHRAGLRAADARVAQPPVRRCHARRRRLPGCGAGCDEWSAGAAARRPSGDRRSVRVLLVLTDRSGGSGGSAGSPEPAGRRAEELAEPAGQVRLVVEADLGRHIGQGLSTQDPVAGGLEPASDHVGMRRDAVDR